MDLIGRVKGILLKPKEELPAMAGEPNDLKSILVPYVVILAAVGPIADFLSHGIIGKYIPATHIFGMTVGGGFVRMPVASLIGAIIGVGVMIGVWWFYGLMYSVLAPSFGGQKNMGGGLKAAAASLTPVFVAGALGLLDSVPYLGWLGLIAKLGAAVYAGFLAVWACPPLLGTPDDKKIGHGLAAFFITLVAAGIALAIVGVIIGVIIGGAMVGAAGAGFH